MALYYGSDGSVWPDEGDALTAAERAEIADFMIAKWQAWKSDDGGTDDAA